MSEKSKDKWYHSNLERKKHDAKMDSLKTVDKKHRKEGYPIKKMIFSEENSDDRDIPDKARHINDALFGSVFNQDKISDGYNDAITQQKESFDDKIYPYKLMANSLSSLAEIGSSGYTLMGGANKLGLLNNPALRTFVTSDRGQIIGSTIGTMADSYQLYTDDDPRGRIENSIELIGDAAGIIGGTNVFRNTNLFNRYGNIIDTGLDAMGYSAAGYDALVKPAEWIIDKTLDINKKDMDNKKNGGPVKLSDRDEVAFRSWYGKLSEFKDLNPDPDDEGQFYDYRGFWKENPETAELMLSGDKEAHFTDLYKLPGHPTFSDESKYGGRELGGKWITGEDGRSYYEPSPYTMSYLDRTMEYLQGTGEGVLLDGEYIMPSDLPDRYEDGGKVYFVKKGDTLSKIAKSHGISLDELLSLNDIPDINKIAIGQKINVPKNEGSMVDEIQDSALNSSKNLYTVKPGDNLYKIAKNNGLSLNELIGLNKNIKDINSISVGQKINLPEPKPEYKPSFRDYRQTRDEERVLNESGDNESVIKSIRHDGNYVVVDKKNKEIKVYDPDNKLVYKTDNIDTGRSGDDYNTITYTDNGRLINHAGNNSTPAGITMITGVSEYHGKPAFVRSRFNRNTGEWDDNLASSMHWEKSKNGSNGCVRLLGNTANEINKYIGEGSMVYTLPEKEGSRFVVREGNLSFVADNPYGSNEGERKNWDDYNVHIDKTYRPLDIDIDNSDIEPGVSTATLNPFAYYKEAKDKMRLNNINSYIEGIEENKKSLMNDYGIDSSTYNDIAELALGIAGQESDYGVSEKYYLKNMIPDGFMDFLKKHTRGRVSFRSNGITQMKIKGDNDEMKERYKRYGIDEESLEDPKNSGLATMIRLIGMYKDEVMGRNFKGKDDIEISPMDALLYKWMGKNKELNDNTATPEDNIYIRNVKGFSDMFNMRTKFDGGGDVEEKQDYIFKRLTEDYNINPMQAIAIVANLTHESGLDTGILGDSGASFGIQQWRDERRRNLEEYARDKGHQAPTMDDQIDFLMAEYNKGQAFQFSKQGRNLYKEKKVPNKTFDYYQFSKSDFDNASSLHDAVIAWNQGVGRPSKKYAMNNERYEIAKTLADRYGIDSGGENFYSDMGYIDPDHIPEATGEVVTDIDKEVKTNINKADKAGVETIDLNPTDMARSFYEAYGKDIVSGMMAGFNTGAGSGESQQTQIQQSMDNDQIATARRIKEEEDAARKRKLLERLLPNIQLAVKGVTQVGK